MYFVGFKKVDAYEYKKQKYWNWNNWLFCTFDNIFEGIENLIIAQANIIPFFLIALAKLIVVLEMLVIFIIGITELTNKEPITTIEAAEPVGPKGYLDIFVIAPCTGNTFG